MKPSDFYLSSRHIFAYVAPGAMWICGGLLIGGKDPLDLVGRSPWGLHVGFFIAGSFVLGFVLQTVVFWVLDKRVPYPGLTDDLHPAKRQAAHLRKALCDDCGLNEIDDSRIPKFCRNLALEYGTYSRHRLLEFENEINFMVALAISLPVVSIGWFFYQGLLSVSAWILGVLTLGYLLFTRTRIPEMRRHESGMWCEKYLILRARSTLGGGDHV
jgi:energy-coupling factor transporter transmembrane protein EcfT